MTPEQQMVQLEGQRIQVEQKKIKHRLLKHRLMLLLKTVTLTLNKNALDAQKAGTSEQIKVMQKKKTVATNGLLKLCDCWRPS